VNRYAVVLVAFALGVLVTYLVERRDGAPPPTPAPTPSATPPPSAAPAAPGVKRVLVSLDAYCKPAPLSGDPKAKRSSGDVLAFHFSPGTCKQKTALHVCAYTDDDPNFSLWGECAGIPSAGPGQLGSSFDLDTEAKAAMCTIAANDGQGHRFHVCADTAATGTVPDCKKTVAGKTSCTNEGSELAMEIEP
jgi:hypothetical protein